MPEHEVASSAVNCLRSLARGSGGSISRFQIYNLLVTLQPTLPILGRAYGSKSAGVLRVSFSFGFRATPRFSRSRPQTLAGNAPYRTRPRSDATLEPFDLSCVPHWRYINA